MQYYNFLSVLIYSLFNVLANNVFVSDSYGTALGAVYAVKVTYTDVQAPILTIEEAILKQSFFPKPCDDLVVGDPEGKQR